MAMFYGRDSDAAFIEECGDTNEEWDACLYCGGLGDGSEAHVGHCAACGGTGSETERQRLRWHAWLTQTGDYAPQTALGDDDDDDDDQAERDVYADSFRDTR